MHCVSIILTRSLTGFLHAFALREECLRPQHAPTKHGPLSGCLRQVGTTCRGGREQLRPVELCSQLQTLCCQSCHNIKWTHRQPCPSPHRLRWEILPATQLSQRTTTTGHILSNSARVREKAMTQGLAASGDFARRRLAAGPKPVTCRWSKALLVSALRACCSNVLTGTLWPLPHLLPPRIGQECCQFAIACSSKAQLLGYAKGHVAWSQGLNIAVPCGGQLY